MQASPSEVTRDSADSARARSIRRVGSRRALPSERALWGAVVCAFALDTATTAAGLAIGLDEANPIAADLIADWGLGALVASKVLVLVLAVATRAAVDDRHGVVVPLGLVVPPAVAVLLNLAAIGVAL